MKSGTCRTVPTQGQKDSSLPVSPSWLGSAALRPRLVVEFCAFSGLKVAASCAWSGRI